jgi:hypothetical protein
MKTVVLILACLSGLAYAQSPFIAGLEREGAGKFAGPVLVSELGCVACHASGNPALAPKPGPDLSSVGSRVNGAHLKEFIAAPSVVKPGTTMPGMFEAVAWTHHGGVGQHDGAAVFLQTIDQTTPVVGRFDGDLSDAVLVMVQQGKDGGQVAGEFFLRDAAAALVHEAAEGVVAVEVDASLDFHCGSPVG